METEEATPKALSRANSSKSSSNTDRPFRKPNLRSTVFDLSEESCHLNQGGVKGLLLERNEPLDGAIVKAIPLKMTNKGNIRLHCLCKWFI